MRIIFLLLLLTIVFMLTGCAGITPIENLSLPPVSIIEGSVVQIHESGFTLKDSSGSIVVRADNPDKKLNLSVDEKIKVYGNLLGGRKKMFDGYVIRKKTGEQIILSNPTPHIGFILQTSFKE